jgi:4a-hydroxytetrahydrobiopterin dehydratase
MSPLDNDTIQEALQSLPDWSYRSNALIKTFTLPDFGRSIALVNGAAEIAEELGHHPDIDIRYNQVTFMLSTRDAGNMVTAKDIESAREIENQYEVIKEL